MCFDFEVTNHLQTINSVFFEFLRMFRNIEGQCVIYELQEIPGSNRKGGWNNVLLESVVRIKQTVSL